MPRQFFKGVILKDFDIKVLQGATFSLGLTIKDSDENPIDLTGYSFRGQIRRTVSSANVEASFSFQVQNQLTETGKVTCFISAEETAAIKVNQSPGAERRLTRMSYDIESEDESGTVVRWLQGVAEINPETTK